MKRSDALKLIAIYHFVMSIPFILGSFILLLTMIPVIFSSTYPDVFWALFGIGIALFFTTIFGVAFLLTGIGIWRCWRWARWAAIALAALMLPGFPFWTIIGGVIIWYLLTNEAREVFDDK